ncbi:MAG: hypothetical protein IJZ95_02670 [Oscillospiraceae bacterium]|nr:hypothetical protein [Oscillospiraceae bacterium]
MAQIPQINNPITAKNYNYSSRPMDANTEPFDIVKLTGVGGSGSSSDAGARSKLEMGNRELIPLSVQVAKDPTLAVETLKDLLNVEVLNQALITGHTELYGKLEDLARDLYVTPEQLVEEIQNQEQQNTMFSGHEFYDVLREVAKTTTDPSTKELIGSLLKSLNFAQNKNEILGALKANMKFLSEYFSPNEKLSTKLMSLSKQWGAEDAEKYFDYLKTETLTILKDVSGSLLNDDKTQMLIPLIIHNLSRYNNSPYMCKEYFNLLMSQISSGTLRESLKNSFTRLYKALFNKQDVNKPTANILNTDDQTSNTGNAEYPKASNPTANNMGASKEASLDNYTTNLSQNQPLTGNLTDKNLNKMGSESDIQHIAESASEDFVENNEEFEEETLSGYRKFLFDSMSEKSFMPLLKHSGYNIEQLLSAYGRGKFSGMETLQNLVKGLFVHDETGEQFEAFLADFSKVNTVQEAIDKLNELLRSMPDIPIRERLYGAFVDVIEQMALKNELPQHGVRPPVSSTLDSLTEFIQENINHPALKSLDSFNATNLLQSLLNAPGVFTPLAHYILPLDVNGTKAFGELWVDNDENNPNNTPGTQRNYHLFLTFDVESIGRFELDMYALGEDVNIALLYPPRFEKQIDPMKDRINKIIRNIGYNARTFETAPLQKPHNLIEIFPKIVDKRTTLNTRV